MEGIALNNCVAIEYIDGKIKIIKSNPSRNAYKKVVRMEELLKK